MRFDCTFLGTVGAKLAGGTKTWSSDCRRRRYCDRASSTIMGKMSCGRLVNGAFGGPDCLLQAA